LHTKARRAILLAGAVLLAGAGARAQTADPIGDLLQGQPAPALEANGPILPLSRALNSSDEGQFRQAMEAARRGEVSRAVQAIATISDPVARKTAEWALADSNGESLGFSNLVQYSRDLVGWPHAPKREAALEKLLETAGKSPPQVLAWFSDHEPQTAQGAMALAQAERFSGQTQPANDLIRHWWRDKAFDADAQRAMLTRFGDVLTQDDHVRRVDLLLYGDRTAAARDLFPLIPADQVAAAEARLALRADARDANALASALPASVAQSPGVIFEHAAYLRRHGLDELALTLVSGFPHDVPTPDAADRVWNERRHLVLTALKAGDSKAAHAACDLSGMTGKEATEAEFFAGWVALTRLKDAPDAAQHFARVSAAAQTPITKARGFYWQGRAAEAAGDKQAAQGFYRQGAQYPTTFYGQLAVEKAGLPLTLVSDPTITPADRARFESMEPVAGARLLLETGHKDLFRVFALNLAQTLPSAADAALLIDMVRGYGGEQFLSMQVARDAAQHGLILPQRAYPVITPPATPGGAEAALVLAITRQESSFDPSARSGAGARGMMQLMPSTANIMARKIGVRYSAERLNDAEYNMQLGSHYLGQLVDHFSGSYVMAAAGYNAGPGRPAQWISYCGDPRGGTTDPIDFIECIPFAQTRDYVMRVMENLEIYKAKAAGGTMPLTMTADLRRGAYGVAITPITDTQAVVANADPVTRQ
jgi:soluble lytic murein transglycosylase